MRNEPLILRVLVIILIILTLISLVFDIWILLRKPVETETHFQGKNSHFIDKNDLIIVE